MRVRLHKYIAHAGVTSRRKAEELMAGGRVSVNGEIASEPGTQVDPAADRVTVDGKPVRPETKVYILLHKPRGFVTTVDDERDRRTVLDLIDGVSERVYPVGRLDRDSEGLLLLTNDGHLSLYLTHPRYGVTKTYRVTVEGYLRDETVERIRAGVRLAGRKVVPKRIELLGRNKRKSLVEIEVGEGLNREVRRIFAACDHECRRLKRLRVGPLTLEGLPRGRARYLSGREVAQLGRAMETAGIDTAELPQPPRPERAHTRSKSARGKRPASKSRRPASGRARDAKRSRPGGPKKGSSRRAEGRGGKRRKRS